MEKTIIDQKPSLVQFIRLFSVAWQLCTRRGLNQFFRIWWSMRKLPLRHSYLYLYTCPKCSPLMPLNFPLNRSTDYRYNTDVLDPSSFVAGCVFCNIARCCYMHFAASDSLVKQCQVHHAGAGYTTLVYSIPDGDAFKAKAVSYTTVQLYSVGKNICPLDLLSTYTQSDEPDPTIPFRSSDHVCEDLKGQEMVKKIQAWIRDCDNSHERCFDLQANFRYHSVQAQPLRLVRLVNVPDGVVRLESPSAPVRFAALSYCWGSKNQNTTLTSNVASRYQHLSLGSLPQTLQDAVYMTKALGIDYLWIDSICVVQDDEQDWVTEAAKMGDIYAAAWIVLAATTASDCFQGFLKQRKRKLDMGPAQLGSGAPNIYARQINNHLSPTDVASDGYPLFQRGWCLQERILARRVLHFLPDEIYMECRTRDRCECGIASYGRPGQPPSLSPFRVMMCQQDENETIAADFGWHWSQMVREYTKLNLTYATDTLPALAGIAQQMTRYQPGTYIAGLWERDIAYLLAWHTVFDPIAPEVIRTPLPEPTFSWTASSRPIEYQSLALRVRPLCQYVSAKCSPTTANLYGHVNSASLCVQGLAIAGLDFLHALSKSKPKPTDSPCKFYFDNGTLSPCRHFSNTIEDACMHGDSHSNWSSAIADWESVILFSLYTWCLPMGGEYVCPLLLGPRSGAEHQYIRLGLVDWLSKEIFDEMASPATVTIT